MTILIKDKACLSALEGYRQVNEKCMSLVEMWKKVQHANIVQLREVFTSNAFGEHCECL